MLDSKIRVGLGSGGLKHTLCLIYTQEEKYAFLELKINGQSSLLVRQPEDQQALDKQIVHKATAAASHSSPPKDQTLQS